MTHDEAEDFLAHYGKVGMKWGQRMATVQAYQEKRFNKKANVGDAIRKNQGLNGRVAKYGGGRTNETVSDNRQIVKTVGVAAAALGAFKVSNLIGNPSVKLGAQVAIGLLTLGTVAKLDSDYNKVNASFKRDNQKQQS